MDWDAERIRQGLENGFERARGNPGRTALGLGGIGLGGYELYRVATGTAGHEDMILVESYLLALAEADTYTLRNTASNLVQGMENRYRPL